MAIIKAKQAAKMSPKEREEKLKELRLELVRSNVTANKANAKTKEIKRAISRIVTSMKAELRDSSVNLNKSLKKIQRGRS